MSGGRIGFLCTYTPGELIEGAGFNPYRLLPPSEAVGSEDLLDSNLCPYVRQVAGALRSGYYPHFQGIVIARSCEASLHFYNILSRERDFNVFLLDLPRQRGPRAQKYFQAQLENLTKWLEELGGKLNEEELSSSLDDYGKTRELFQDTRIRAKGVDIFQLASEYNGRPRRDFNAALEGFLNEKCLEENALSILLTGAIPPQGLINILEGEEIILDTCLGLRGFLRGEMQGKNLFSRLSHAYLNRPPCPRFLDGEDRLNLFSRLLETQEIQGVIYHDLGFCDVSSYDFLIQKKFWEDQNVPLLKVKTELGRGETGQILTRVEAFLETLEEGGEE